MWSTFSTMYQGMRKLGFGVHPLRGSQSPGPASCIVVKGTAELSSNPISAMWCVTWPVSAAAGLSSRRIALPRGVVMNAEVPPVNSCTELVLSQFLLLLLRLSLENIPQLQQGRSLQGLYSGVTITDLAFVRLKPGHELD